MLIVKPMIFEKLNKYFSNQSIFYIFDYIQKKNVRLNGDGSYYKRVIVFGIEEIDQ